MIAGVNGGVSGKCDFESARTRAAASKAGDELHLDGISKEEARESIAPKIAGAGGDTSIFDYNAIEAIIMALTDALVLSINSVIRA